MISQRPRILIASQPWESLRIATAKAGAWVGLRIRFGIRHIRLLRGMAEILLVTGAAMIAALTLHNVFGGEWFVPFIVAVALTVGLCGLRSGVCAAGLSAAGAAYIVYLTPPFAMAETRWWLLVLSAVVILVLTGGLRYARNRAEIAARTAEAACHGENAARLAAERDRNRTALLQALATAFSEALTPEQVADVVISKAMPVLGASVGAVATLDGRGEEVHCLRIVGLAGIDLEAHPRFPVTSHAPISDAARNGEVIILNNRDELCERYPDLAGAADQLAGVAAVPLRSGGRTIGGFSLGFPEARPFKAGDSDFIVTLGRCCAQALDRAQHYVAEQAARRKAAMVTQRLTALAEISETLASSVDYQETLKRVGRVITNRFADWCVLFTPGHDGALRPTAVAHRYPSHQAALESLLDRLDRAGEPGWRGPSQVVRTGEPQFIPHLNNTSPEQERDAPTTLALARALETTSYMCIPLRGYSRTLGAIALGRCDVAGSGFTPADLSLAQEIGWRCAMAIDNARLYQEAKDALAAEHAERRRLQQVIDMLPEALVVTDARGRHIVDNAAAKALFGVDGAGPVEGGMIMQPDGGPVPSGQTPVERALLHGEVVRGERFAVKTPSATNSPVPVLVSAAPLLDEAGETGGSVALLEDITALNDLVRKKDELLLNISHDLKGPLATIKGNAQLLRRSREGASLHLIGEGLQRIEATATHMAAQINEVVELAARQMEPTVAARPARVDLLAVARDVVSRFETASDAHTVTLWTSLSKLVGLWHAASIERVLENLLENALKYSPCGGRVEVSVDRVVDGTGRWAACSVRDHGLGIPADDLPHVFERFYRGRNVQDVDAGGTGIGLARVRWLVESQGGQITADSNEGVGSTFTVRLPLIPEDAQGKAGDDPSGEAVDDGLIEKLTPREAEVLRWLSRGLTNAQIAEQLIITPFTVNMHLRSIYGKLGVSTRSAATRYALEHSLV